MWTPEDFPGADHVPWQLLIRARFAHEVDAVVASVALSRVAALTSVDVARTLVETAGVTAGRDKASPETVLTAMNAVLDFDDWCGTVPRPWPWPRRRGFEELSDPLAGLVAEQAHGLVMTAGSPELQASLGSVLAEVGNVGR